MTNTQLRKKFLYHLLSQKRQIIDKEEDSLRSLMSIMVNVTIEVQDRMRTMFLPTAERCHYIFTLRDMRLLFR